MTDVELPHGPFRTPDAEALGMTRRGLADAVTNGTLRRVVRGVYQRTTEKDTLEGRAAAVALVVTPDSVLRDRAAAWLHGVDVYRYRDSEVVPPLETCVLRDKEPTRRREVDGRTRDLRPDDIMVVGGVRVTTPLRTALDLGCNLPRREALAALDTFMRLHGLTHEQMAHEARRYHRRRGVRQLRRLIPLADPRAESPRESWTRLEIVEAGHPTPEVQWWVEIGGVPTYRLDLAYPRHRIAIEYDGEEWHDRTDEQRCNDAERRSWLERHGWTVIVVRSGDFHGPGLARWLRELSEALRPTYPGIRF